MKSLHQRALNFEAVRTGAEPYLEAAHNHIQKRNDILESIGYLAIEQTGTDEGLVHDWHEATLYLSVWPEVKYRELASIYKASRAMANAMTVLLDIRALSRYAKAHGLENHAAASQAILAEDAS